MHEALALQIGQGRAELVRVQDEAGQVQAVLPHLEERAELWRRERKIKHRIRVRGFLTVKNKALKEEKQQRYNE